MQLVRHSLLNQLNDTIPYHRIVGQLSPPPKPLLSIELVEEFFKYLQDLVSEVDPVGRCLPQDEEERLARVCVLLALFQQAQRGHDLAMFRQEPFHALQRMKHLDALLKFPRQHWVDYLCAISRRFASASQELLGAEAVLGPIFAGGRFVGGAQGDLVIDGRLVDVKTSDRVQREHLYQLLAYALLDLPDQYNVHTVALYLADYGPWFTWPLLDLIQTTSQEPKPVSVQEARARFIGALQSRALR